MKHINNLIEMTNVMKQGRGTSPNSCPDRGSSLMLQSGKGAVDVTVALYEAPDEHPMSTRSASDGRRWKTRGWKYVAMIVAVLVMSMANIGMAWGAASTSSDSKYATGTITFADFGSMSVTTNYWYNGIKVYSGGSQTASASNSRWATSVTVPTYISNVNAGNSTNKISWGSSGAGKQYSMSGLALNTYAIGIHVNGKCTVTVVVDKNIGSDTDDAGITASVDATAYGTAWTSSNYSTAGTALTVTSTRADKTNYPGRYTLTIPITTDGEKVVKISNSSSGTGAGKLFCFESITVTASGGGGDVTAPTLSSSTPANAATDVAVSGNITLTFSENVTINDASKFTLSGGAGTLNTASATASGTVVTIPYSGLANNTTYTLATAAEAVKDGSNNKNAALSNISFTTVAAAVPCPSSGTLYTAAVKGGVSSVSIPASSTHLFTSSEITITGGKLSAINPQGSAKNMIDGSLFKTTNNNTIFKIELDCILEEGDVITIDGKGGTKDATGDVGLWVSTSESRPGSAPACKGTSATTSLVDDLVNYTVTSSDEYIGKQVLYIHRAVGSGTQFNNINISRPVASACDWNINYITNGLKDGNASAVWSENNCFTQVGSTNEWILENFEMPDVAGQFWVGPGSFGGHSVVADLSTIKWVYRSDKSRTSKSAVTNMTGTLNIWSDSGDDNYYTGIYPDYQITYGIDGSGGWTKVDFNHVSGTEYRTAIVTAPSGYKNNDNFKYYVGLRTKDNGNTYWGDHSSTVKMNGMSGMSSTDQAGKKGQWKMYEDSGSDNYYCSWIPVYTLTYNANGGSGAPAAQEVISDAVPCQWTLSTTQPTWADHVFLGWSTNSSASVPDAASEVADLGTPYSATGDVTLYAVWTSCSGPTINSFVPTGKTDGTWEVGTTLGSITVTATAGNGGALSYLWYQYDGGNIGAAVAAAGTNNAATYNIPNNVACVERHYYCVVSEAGCSTTRTSDASGALTLTEPVDPCSEPAEVTNEIARFFVPCGTSAAYNVTDQTSSTGDNTYTTTGFNGDRVTNATTGFIYGKLAGSDDYIQLKLNTGNFRAGDVVNAYFSNNNANNNLKLKSSSGNELGAASASGYDSEYVRTYTLTAADIEDNGSIKFFRKGSDIRVNRIIVTREPVCFEITDAKKPGSGWSDRTSSAQEITSSMLVGTITGGTVLYTGSGTLGANGSYGLVFDNNNDEITITLSSGILPAGAMIVIGARGTDGTSSHECGFTVSGNSMSPATTTSSTKGNSFTQTYTVAAADGIIGGSSFTIARVTDKSKTYLESIYIVGCEACSNPVINEGSTKTSFAGGSWAQNSGHTITITATGASSYEWYRNTSATDAGATKLSETSNTLDITADVTAGTYFFKAVAKSGDCSSSTEWSWCGAMTITAATYSITYNCDGATSGCPSDVASATNLPNPLPSAPTKAGYTFDGWYTNSAKSDAAVAGAALTGNTTLYAKWIEDAPSTYSVEWSQWSSPLTQLPDNTTSTINGVVLNGTGLARTTVWSGETYNMGNGEYFTINLPSDYEITAISTAAFFDTWRASTSDNSNTNKLYIQFCSSSTYNSSYDIDDPIMLGDGCYDSWGNLGNPPTAKGITPIPAGAQSAKIYCAGNNNEGCYIYRVIVEVTERSCTPHTLSFAAGGATGSVPGSRNICEGVVVELPGAGALSKAGNTFAGWSDGVNTYAAGASYTMPGTDKALTAQWTPFVVPAVTDLAIDPSSTPTSVLLTWNIPGKLDLSTWSLSNGTPDYFIVYQKPASASYDNTAEELAVTHSSPAWDQYGVAIPAEITNLESLTYEYKGHRVFPAVVKGSEDVLYWDYDNTPSAADWTKITQTPTTTYPNAGTVNPLPTSRAITFCANPDHNATDETFYIRDAFYHTTGMIDIDHVVLMRKEGSAAADTTSGTRLYSGKASHYTDSPVSASTTYYYTIFAVHADGSLSAGVTVVRAATGYTVTYNYNGATGGASPASETGASVTLPTPTRTGYELQGWYTTDGTKAGDGGDTYEPEVDITLYAKWYATCATGGESTLVDINFKDASWTGKTFSQGNDNNEDLINGVYFWSKNADKHFSLASNTSNGLTFPDANMSSGNSYFCIPITGINNSDKQITVTLKHGYSSKTASYKYVYVDGRTSFVDANTNGSGGTTVSDANNAATQMSVTVNSLSNTSGHLMIGRNSSSYTNIYGVTVTTPQDGTCYHVTYDGNGATSGFVNDTTAYKSGDEVTVLGNDGRYPYVNGILAIKGWADTEEKADAGTVDYAPGATFTISNHITLYAVWSNDYAITYNLNGASWAGGYSAPAQYTYGTGATLPVAGNMSNPGYTFNGWYANSDLSTGGVVTAIGTSESGSKEFWAKWTENTYTVTYNANGGSGSMETTVGRYVYLRENTFTYAGHIFMGWNTADNGSGVSYNDEDEVELTADMTLYAQWASDYNITWGIVQIGGAGAEVIPNVGGGNYTITASVSGWTGSLDASMISSETSGVTITNVAVDNSASPKTATVTFSVGTTVASDAIVLSLYVPAYGTYAGKESEKEIEINRCAGSPIVWDFTTNAFLKGGTWSISAGAENKAYAADGTTILKYYAGGGGDTWSEDNKQLQTQGTTAFSTGTGKKQMTQKYFFFPTLSGAGTISVVYGTNSSSLKIYEATSTNIYGLDPIITLTDASATSSTYTFSSDKKYYMTMESSKVYFKRITFTPSGGAAITPTLNWETDLSGGESKRTSDDGFIHTASQNMNSLGAITYSSTNTAVATVNATTGEVHLEGAAGEATITATIAASGCYNSASVSYVLTVIDDCDDVAGTITTEDLGCAGIKMTIEEHTAAAGVTYQWYKVGTPDVTVGSNQDNFTTSDAGSYYVVVTNTGDRHCAKRSRNTVEVEAQAAVTATKIVDSWYVKNGRRTPDVELVQTTNANGFIVKIGETKIWDSDGSETTGFGGCGFHLGENGIIYLNGTKDNGDAPSGLTGDGETEILKITAKGCGGDADELSITIHKQVPDLGARPSVAFVVDGTEKGTFTQANATHSTESALYQFLDYGADETGAFDLTAQNIYSSVNEKDIREHFSQYDAILITDDPSTNKVPNKEDYKTGGYVNAFGTMIDVRPILSMEAYVSKLSNWGAKGVAGDPSSPNPRQYEMRLQCKDHEIYSGLPAPAAGTHVWSETIDGEEYRHVIMVDSTKSPYAGVPYNEQTGGKQKPALQGFESEDMGNLLGLGLILNGTLHAGVERQEEPAARMMLLGIQNQALPNALTEEGKKVIENALKYLLKTNMEEVDDCSNFFKGGTEGKERDWNTATNWEKNTLPTYETKVRILAPCEISGITARVAQVDIATSGTSRHIPGGTCSGSLTIMPSGALVVGGKVRTAEAPHFAANDLMPTTPEDLVINTNGSNQAALIFNNDEAETQATVNLFSLGRKSGDEYQFQYMAVPMENVKVNPSFAGSGIYTYVWHENGGWERRGYYTELFAFEGVGITTKFDEASHNYTMSGNLTSTKEKVIALTNSGNEEDWKGDNIIGNSWMAPIDIASLKTAIGDDDNVDKAVYIYCTGNDGESVHSGSTEAAGQWLTIPIDASGWSGWEGLKVIPAMQAFLIHASAESSLTLNYNDLVRKTATANLNEKLRAPRRTAADTEDFTGMKMRVTDSQTHTDLYLFEGGQFSEDYDNGWEAKFMEGDGRSAQFYAMSGENKMAVLATDELEGTAVGFAPGKESTYTITFVGGDGRYYLNDLKEQQSTLIEEGNSYSFTFEEGDMPHRFLISITPFGIPSVITGCENVSQQEKAQKIIYNDHVYIIRGGKIYDAVGQVVK